MKIEINLKLIIAIILFFLLNNLKIYIIFLGFIILHELGHLIVGILVGGKPKKISIHPFGMSLEIISYEKKNIFYKVIFYLVGPLINILCAIIFMNLKINDDIQKNIVYINLSIGLFNLLPILPLDGGKVLREILIGFFDVYIANFIIINISKIFLIIITISYSVLILEIKNIYILFLIIYLWHLFIIEEKKYILYKKMVNSIKNI